MTPESFIKEAITLYGPLAAGWIVAWYVNKKLDEERQENKQNLRDMFEREIKARDKDIELKTALIANLRGLRELIRESIS